MSSTHYPTAGNSMRILMPTVIDPRVHTGGGGAATRGFLELLRRNPLNASIECVPIPAASRTYRRARRWTAVARSFVSCLPSKAALTYSRAFLRAIRRLLRERDFDLVLLNGSDLLWLLPELPPATARVLLAHNIEHQLFRSRIDSLPPASAFLRGALLRDWRRLRRYEMTGMRAVENVIFLSGIDAELARRECGALRTLVVPPVFGYEPPERRPGKAEAGLEVGFLADFSWWPNREGLRWFLKTVFPHTHPDTRLHVFGSGSLRVAPDHPRIVKHGYLPDVRQVWPVCDLMVCPIFSGGGVSVKFAEALHNGMPMLATRFAARGLSLEPCPGIVLLDGADEWVRFLRSPAARSLRSCRRSGGGADAFKVRSHADTVHDFLRETVERRSGQCAGAQAC